MLFHTWTFLLFMTVVLPVLFVLRRTRLWIPWLLIASYTFYGWWNPYYLILVFYSTLLDFILVALMDHCPMERKKLDWRIRLARLHFDDRAMKAAFIVTGIGTLLSIGMFLAGPLTLRPTMAMAALILSFMAAGAFLCSRRTWLVVSIVNNFAILAFFKYARFIVENLNTLLASFHFSARLPDPSTLMPFGAAYVLPV